MERSLALIGSLLLAAVQPAWGMGRGPQGFNGSIRSGTLEHGGLTRRYFYHLPEGTPSGRKPALVILLHGGSGNPDSMVKLTFGRFNELADRDGFIALYPEGVDKQWNDGRDVPNSRAHKEKLDDLGFLSALIDRFHAEHGTDPKRVYVTGISNGAMMSFRLACELSHKIAAVAPVTGSIPRAIFPSCKPGHPLSVVVLNGDADPLVPYEGGHVHFGRQERGEILPTREAVRHFARRNGCSLDAKEERLADRDPGDGTTVSRLAYRNPRTGAAVVLYTIHGGGHTWPMGRKYLREKWIGRVSRELDASDLIWEFFKEHPKR